MSVIWLAPGSFLKKTCVPAATLFAVALCGCSRLEVKLGWRVDIAKLPVASMDARLQGDPGVAPGERSPLIVTLLQPDGTVLTTTGAGKGKVRWSDLVVTATTVSVNKKGVVSLAHDPRLSDGKMGHVTITVPSHPGLHVDLDIPVRYDYAFAANFSGSNGTNGLNGTDGTSGSNGSMGSMDPNNPSAGGDGGNGTDGGDGGNGSDGGDGPNVRNEAAAAGECSGGRSQAVVLPGRPAGWVADGELGRWKRRCGRQGWSRGKWRFRWNGKSTWQQRAGWA